MKLPGFTADASICKSSRHYLMEGTGGSTVPRPVRPAHYGGWFDLVLPPIADVAGYDKVCYDKCYDRCRNEGKGHIHCRRNCKKECRILLA